MSNDNRAKMLQRIANLRAMADRGATEAEAMSALARAERLMHSYKISEAELAMAEATGEVVFEITELATDPLTVGRAGRVRHKVQTCVTTIADFTDTQCVLDHNQKVAFTGDRPDAEMATYLTEMIRGAMDSGYNSWRRDQMAVGRGAKGAFQIAMGSRINARLRAMISDREEKVRQLALPDNHVRSELTSTALVVVSINKEKQEKVTSHFQAKYPRLRKGSGFSYQKNSSAQSAGLQAGDKVNFGRPVGGNDSKRIAA